MGFIWISFLIEIAIFFIVKPLIEKNSEMSAIILILTHTFFVLIGLSRYKKQRLVFVYAYYVRLLTMFWDVYMRHIFLLPDSGSDSEAFLHTSLIISNNLSLLNEDLYGGIYSKIVGIVYYLTVPERLIGQYLNVLLGISVIILTYKILQILEINGRIVNHSIIILSIFPYAILMSAIHLRESFIVFFITLSFYFFAKWYRKKSIIFLICSIISLLIASIFHSGAISLIIGLLFMSMFYEHRNKSYRFSVKTVTIFVIFVIITYIIYFGYQNIFFKKFTDAKSMDDIYEIANRRRGGSVYLTGLKVDSILDIILFSPIRMIYFLISPLPWDWRGINDILAFCNDSIFYLFVIFYSLKNYKKARKTQPILLSILIMILSTVFVFAIGVHNAGTAMRHRHKIMPIILIFYALIRDTKRRYFH